MNLPVKFAERNFFPRVLIGKTCVIALNVAIPAHSNKTTWKLGLVPIVARNSRRLRSILLVFVPHLVKTMRFGIQNGNSVDWSLKFVLFASRNLSQKPEGKFIARAIAVTLLSCVGTEKLGKRNVCKRKKLAQPAGRNLSHPIKHSVIAPLLAPLRSAIQPDRN